jgi:pseudaminic acid cytidylyltransferase
MIIAIIPARGGSQRIKRKNIKKFFSKPILYWTIKILKKSNLFDKIIVSTDDLQIKKISQQLGINQIIDRPKNLSDNITATKPVIEHAIKTLSYKDKIKYVCCVYPCNPFLNIKDLKKCFKILKKNLQNFIFPITEYPHPIQRAFKLKENNKIIFFEKKNELKRTQDLIKSFHDAGQFYWGEKNNWLSKKKLHSSSIGLPISKWRSVDIDNKDDWKKAELLFKMYKKYEKI